jgi:hypothetical protein
MRSYVLGFQDVDKTKRLIGNSGDLGQFAGLLVGVPTRQPTNQPYQPPEIRLSQQN